MYHRLRTPIWWMLMLLACAPSLARQDAAPGAQTEYWMGLIATGEASIPEMTFVVTFQRASPGEPWTATLDVPRAPGVGGAIGVRLKEVAYTEQQIKFVSPPPPAENLYEADR